MSHTNSSIKKATRLIILHIWPDGVWLKLNEHYFSSLISPKMFLTLLHQPQNSMPDVIIWMLRGEKRVAFARIPAHRVLYSNFSEQACGKHCGRTQTIFMQVPWQVTSYRAATCFVASFFFFYPLLDGFQYPMDKNKGVKIPVQLRVNMWLGLSAWEKKFNIFSEGNFSVYAEMVTLACAQ